MYCIYLSICLLVHKYEYYCTYLLNAIEWCEIQIKDFPFNSRSGMWRCPKLYGVRCNMQIFDAITQANHKTETCVIIATYYLLYTYTYIKPNVCILICMSVIDRYTFQPFAVKISVFAFRYREGFADIHFALRATRWRHQCNFCFKKAFKRLPLKV